MPDQEKTLSIEVLIISFDGYSDVWELSISSFLKYWPDCPYKINLLTNHKIYPDPRIHSLCVGPDIDWSTSLLSGLQKINSVYVLTFFEDLILSKPVNTGKIVELVSICEQYQYDYLRLRPSPPPDGKENLLYGSIYKGSAYRVSLCTSIVKRSLLIDLLEKGESAWAFEKYGSLRSERHAGFYSTYDQIIPYINAIEKGRWNAAMIEQLKASGIDYTKRGLFLDQNQTNRWTEIKHFLVFHLMPVQIRKIFYALRKKFK